MIINIFNKILAVSSLIFFISTSSVLAYLPSDPMYSKQSEYLNYLNIPAAWDIARGEKVVVAILDSGVDVNNPDIAFNIWKNQDEVAGDNIDNDNNGYVDDVAGWDFVDQDSNPSPVADDGYDKASLNHGTALAGIIGAVANNGIGITGIAFNSKIMPIRILKSDGEGFVDNLVAGIDYAVKNGADIINLSLVGFEQSTSLESAIAKAHESGVLVVAASGNSETGKPARNLDLEPAYPVCYGVGQDNTVLGVASIGLTDEKSTFSNYGSTCVDVAALGENLTSLAYYNPDQGLTDYYSNRWYGTSFSTAIVSGMAALIKSKNLSLDANDLTNLIINNSTNINNSNPDFQNKLGHGKIDIIESLNNTSQFIGKLIKLADSSAVYYLDQNQTRHLFSNQNIFFSWYDGNWSDQDIEIVSQYRFDSYSIGKNVTIRPGTKLMKFQNSGRIYAVSYPNTLHYADNDVLIKLYPNYNEKLITMQNSFESDYVQGNKLDGNVYPDSTLIQYVDSDAIWYIENGQKRELTGDSFMANGFNDEYVIKSVGLSFYYDVSTPVKNLSFNLFPYAK